MATKNIITTQSTKIAKGEKLGWLTAVLYLAPADESGVLQTCPAATCKVCKQGCLRDSGCMAWSSSARARQWRTELLASDPDAFHAAIDRDLESLKRRADKLGMRPAFRPNGTSDMPGMARAIAKRHPDLTVYDYTKIPQPHKRTLDNYHLTFSYDGYNWEACRDALANGINVAVVFSTKRSGKLPGFFRGMPVVDGDTTDLRFLDQVGGCVIGLRAKGKARKDNTGFVVKVD